MVDVEPDNEEEEEDEDTLSWFVTIGEEMYLKQEFRSKRNVQAAIKHYCMNKHQEAVVVESTTKKLSIKCRKHEEGCNWRVRAIKPKNSSNWVVSKWVGRHTCVSATLSQDHRQLDSQFISEAILDMVKASPSVVVILIQERVTGLFGFNVSYRKAWKAKQKAIAKIYSDWDESYVFSPRWFGHILKFSPRWCKSVIHVDGTHKYNKYKGTLLIVTAQDGNNEVLPIAFAVVEGYIPNKDYFYAAYIKFCSISPDVAAWIEAIPKEKLTQNYDECG
ncbi:uncharacterized protein LOC133301373 [Gastrolobium bilobum]|uniref:uncharacterized protein LOC133301373 n=1 Tax=Gastrolobium bilobum TaxID=150636 RepID=UPI002AAF9794|nr:uncharacterized protein LOC133301373 [Gastrolobium bilobum]